MMHSSMSTGVDPAQNLTYARATVAIVWIRPLTTITGKGEEEAFHVNSKII